MNLLHSEGWVIALAESLKENNSLTTIFLVQTLLILKGAKALIEALKDNTVLLDNRSRNNRTDYNDLKLIT